MAYSFVCPLCGKKKSGYPAEVITMCEACGKSIGRKAPRMLLVGKSSYHTFCSPECLKKYQTPDELYSKKGATRETE